MANLVITVAVETAVAPVGVVPGNRRFRLVNASGVVAYSVDLEATDLAASFADVADGTYSATVVQLDINGDAFGDAVTSADTVTVAPVVVGVAYDKVVTVSLALAE